MAVGRVLLSTFAAAALAAVWTDEGGRFYTIDPIRTAVGAAGDKDGFAALLRTEVTRLTWEANDSVVVRPEPPAGRASQIKLAGTDVTLDDVRRVVRSILQRRDVVISGSLSTQATPRPSGQETCFGPRPGGKSATAAPHPYRLVLTDSENTLLLDCTGSYADLARQGALAILSSADPFSLATILMKDSNGGQFEEARIIAEAAREDGQATNGLWTFRPVSCIAQPNYDLARAHLTLGILYHGRDRFADAEQAFEAANVAFKSVKCPSRWVSTWPFVETPDWPAAKDGIAAVKLTQARLSKTVTERDGFIAAGQVAAREALAVDPKFQTAMHHLGESFDMQFVPDANDTPEARCRKLEDYGKALDAYGALTTAHPRYAPGYTLSGDLLFRRLEARRSDGPKDPCPNERAVADDVARAEAIFAGLMAADPSRDRLTRESLSHLARLDREIRAGDLAHSGDLVRAGSDVLPPERSSGLGDAVAQPRDGSAAGKTPRTMSAQGRAGRPVRRDYASFGGGAPDRRRGARSAAAR